MSDPVLSAELLPEPELEFATGQQIEHPATGLGLFGPVDSSGIEKPNRISYAVIGSPDGIAGFGAFATRLNSPIDPPPERSEILWPHYPGFEEAMHAVFPKSAPLSEPLDPKKIEATANQGDDHKRVFDVTSLYLSAIQALARKDTAIDVTICVVPEIVYTNCRPLSKVSTGTGKRLSGKEIRLRRQTADLFGGYDSEQYDFSLDFRRQIKARAMECKMPIQIVRESTLNLSDEKPPWGQRVLTPLSDRAWNLSTALYYKSGRKPWIGRCAKHSNTAQASVFTTSFSVNAFAVTSSVQPRRSSVGSKLLSLMRPRLRSTFIVDCRVGILTISFRTNCVCSGEAVLHKCQSPFSFTKQRMVKTCLTNATLSRTKLRLTSGEAWIFSTQQLKGIVTVSLVSPFPKS